MSSAWIDKKRIAFDLSVPGVAGNFILTHIDGDEVNSDKIQMEMLVRTAYSLASTTSSTCITIDKGYTVVLSTVFRQMADIMDEWYKKDDV